MIDFIDVKKTYKSGVEALKGVSFTIDDGEFVFIIGKSGSGKSTLLKCITCEETPTEGKVTIDDFCISTMSRALVPVLRRQIGMIYQDFRLIESKTVAENVAFAGEIIGVPKKSLSNTVSICLSSVGLKDKANAYPQELSGGEQQRVAIARAMVNNPKLIVADEPTGNLDPDTSESIMAMLLEINRNGTRGNKTTVIICTHDSNLVDRMKQRVIEIDNGLLVRDEFKSGYKDSGSQAPAAGTAESTAAIEQNKPGTALVFGDDGEYNDNYDDSGYPANSGSDIESAGFVFGDEKPSQAAAVPEQSAVPDNCETPAMNRPSDDLLKAADEADPDITEETVPDELIMDGKGPEIIEINVPEQRPGGRFISFGDEEYSDGPDEEGSEAVFEAQPADTSDPDEEEVRLTAGQSDDESKPEDALMTKKEMRLAKKNARRNAKIELKASRARARLERKENVSGTSKADRTGKKVASDFDSGNDIDMMPEDDD